MQTVVTSTALHVHVQYCIKEGLTYCMDQSVYWYQTMQQTSRLGCNNLADQLCFPQLHDQYGAHTVPHMYHDYQIRLLTALLVGVDNHTHHGEELTQVS